MATRQLLAGYPDVGLTVIEGVSLRDVEERDLPSLFAFQLDPEANRMAVSNPRDAEAFDAHWVKVLADRSNVTKVILENDVVVGSISAFKMDGEDTVGYWVARERWGRGIATRALTLLLEEVAIRPLHARVAKTNVASIRVLQRCGFTITGYQMSPPDDQFPECEEAILILTA